MLSLSEQKRPGGGAWPAAVLTHRVLRCNINRQEMRNPALRIELSLTSHSAAGGRARVINGVETAPTMQRSPDTAMPISERLARATHAIGRLSAEHVEARVTAASGVRAVLPPMPGMLSVGDRLEVIGRDGAAVPAQVTSSTAQDTTITLFRDATGLGAGSPARLPICPSVATLPIGPGWIGRVVDPLGQPLDGRGALPLGEPQPIRRAAPPAATRARVGPAVTLGVRAMDLFTTCRLGQRMGLFAGPGVGKSTLLGMLARWSAFDVVVVALVGERGREVREFLEDDLGPDGRERSLMFVATRMRPR